MEYIGYDNQQEKLKIGDICSFKINKINYEGIITYDESEFAFIFEMEDDKFPCVFMCKADLGSIKKIINVYSTKINDEYEFYRKLFK